MMVGMDPLRDFRPRYIGHIVADTEPCAAYGCGKPSAEYGEPTINGEFRVNGQLLAPIHVSLRYCAEHLPKQLGAGG